MNTDCVAPYAGAWIEILAMERFREAADVAPYAGAWIEIRLCESNLSAALCRSLRGSVD